MSELIKKAQRAKEASHKLSNVSSEIKDNCLQLIAQLLIENQTQILKANKIDIQAAKDKGISGALLDRLTLDNKRIESMADGVMQIKGLVDPVGEVTAMWKRPNGLNIGVKRVPLGVIGIIYEARPNVTVDAAALCLKAGNAVILKGGSEAINSNKAIVSIMKQAVRQSALHEGVIELVESTDRKTATEMMKLNQYIDVLIPRGGAGLINTVVNNSTIPVIQTGVGNCHIYVDCESNQKMAEEIVVNAKAQRPGVCNAAETLLVHKKIADEFLPKVLKALENNNVKIKGCNKTCRIYGGAACADENDWKTEYLDYIIAVKVVEDINEAIEHITKYGTKHSEAIITTNYNKAQKFLDEIDAAAVYVNASTRFTDGCEFGFGAEIGISTQKLHARGPMGLKQLTTNKYIIYGNGQIRN